LGVQDNDYSAVTESEEMRYRVNLRITKNWSGTVTDVSGTVDAVPYPPMPGIFCLKPTREFKGMLYAVIGLPGPSASDVVTQELTIQVGDATPVTTAYAAADTVSAEFEAGAAGTVVKATLVDVDGSDNRSEPREEVFTVTDTIAPPTPGEFTLTVTRQD
jgi:hypothetical protein